MRDRKDKQLNQDDLKEVKSLIGDARGEDFSLDEILAEFGSGKVTPPEAVPVTPLPLSRSEADLPWPSPPKRKRGGGKVVEFPGPVQSPFPDQGGEDREEPETEFPFPQAEEPLEEAEEESLEEDELSEDEEAASDDGEDRVIEFPEEESVLSAFLKDMSRKADDYADRMFEEDERTDPQEVRRLERLIPGTDREEEPEEPRRYRRPKRVEPPPPDLPPKELSRTFGKGLKVMRLRVILLCLLSLAALVQSLTPLLGLVWLPPLDQPMVQNAVSAALMGLGLLLSLDLLAGGVARAFRGKVGMDTLATLAALATLADGIMLTIGPNETGRLPYTAAALVGLWLNLHGLYHKKCAQRLSCRTAAASAEPYRVTLDEGKWNGRDTYAKWSGTAEGFGSQIQVDDGAQRIYSRICPLLLLGALVLAGLSTVVAGHPQDLVWGLSALFTVTAAYGSGLAYGRSFHKVARRLVQSGGALAGWPGIANSRRGDRVLITDTDLFPPGTVKMNGYKVLGNFPLERVLSYAATLIQASGSGLAKPFHDELRAQGGLMRRAERLCCYEGGGLSANIRGDQVLVGSAAFMNLMEIPLPVGLHIKNTVFCAINGELAGIFPLSYTLPDTVFPSLEELMREKVGPVLATRDFNLIPATLQQRHKLAADRMDFPPVERRRELSDPDQPHSQVLTALLCREGLFPFAEVVTAARRLRLAARLGAGLCCVGSALGLLLCSYLVSVSAYGSLSPINLLIYLLTWLGPVWFLTSWVHRF